MPSSSDVELLKNIQEAADQIMYETTGQILLWDSCTDDKWNDYLAQLEDHAESD